MTRRIEWISIAFLLAAATLFFFENRAAYKAYFSDDDLNNIGWPTYVGNDVFYEALLTPKFIPSNFRPAGFLYYRVMGRVFKMRYPPYVEVLQAFHILNAIVLFALLRSINLSMVSCWAGSVFYAFDTVAMEAYWKPMYVFDLFCGTLCLVTLLLYIRGHWLLALPAFWLAYKSKEIAVMLPLVLLAYEWLLGPRNWKRLAPFFAISLSFGLQALWHNAHMKADDVYALNFTPQLVWNSIAFYSSSILFVPLGGILLLAAALLFRDPRIYFGLIAMVSLLAPMIALTNRVANAYWYVPLIGLGIVIAAMASHVPRWAVALFFVLWLPLNYVSLRDTRKAILAQSDEARWYVSGLSNIARRIPRVKTVVFETTPPYMKPWGVDGAIRQVFGVNVDVVWAEDERAAKAMRNVPVAIVTYYPVPHIVRGLVRTNTDLPSAIDFEDHTLASQFGPGWYAGEASPARRIGPKAEVTLYRPAESREFTIDCFVPAQNRQLPVPSEVTVLEDGVSLGVQTLSNLNGQTLRWKLPAGTAGNRHVTILSQPVRYEPRDPAEYGIAIRSLRYVAR